MDGEADNQEPCNCGEQWCTGFKPKGPTRYIIPQHISGECPERDTTIATLRQAVATLRAELATYAEHSQHCDKKLYGDPCDCGAEETIAVLAKTENL